MKILALRADAGGCAFYRIQEPARVVSEQYDDVDIRVATSVQVDAYKDSRTGLTSVREIKEDVDLIIFQRPLLNAFTSMIQQARKQGIATVVELDDDFTSVHPQNMAWRHMQPTHSPISNYEWVQSAAFEADMVTVSTPELEKFAPHGRVQVLRNCLPESVFNLRKQSNTDTSRVVGWSGTVATHPNDLEQTEGGVARALKKQDASFFNVGDGAGVGSALGLGEYGLVNFSGWVPLDDYYQTIIDNIGVGIVPLEMSTFNQAKSALKGLEYAALGIPFVASPTDEYVRLVSQGAGVLAGTSETWSAQVGKLLKDPRRRYSAGQRYRKHIKDTYTYEANAYQWYNTWKEAIQIAKVRHAAA